MSIEEKKELMQSMAEMMKGAKVEQMIMFAESGSKIVYKEVEPEPKQEAGEKKESEENEGIKHEDLAKAVSAVQSYMWGASAYAVLYCELRDHRGYLGNVAQLEREIDGIADEMKLDWSCKEGTISDAFRNNPFLEKHVDRWKEIGAKSRVIHLLDHLQQVLP